MKAVILAAGIGKRMRRTDVQVALTPSQSRVADSGIKAMVPFARPFLDYLLSNVAEAGCRRICLVVGRDHREIIDYYAGLSGTRIEIEFVIQAQPLGTANAVAAAESFAGQDDVLVLNGDNYYPTSALRALVQAAGTALIGFDRDVLVRHSHIPHERILAFAVVEQDSDGYLTNIVEKPTETYIAARDSGSDRAPLLVSMNCWRFRPSIFTACRSIGRSPRGEFELPDAVIHTIRELGERYRVLPCAEGVLDLTSRSDIASVGRLLEQAEVRL